MKKILQGLSLLLPLMSSAQVLSGNGPDDYNEVGAEYHITPRPVKLKGRDNHPSAQFADSNKVLTSYARHPHHFTF